MIETWAKISGFDNYSVSDQGNVKNNKTNKLIVKDDNKGYLRVNLWIRGRCYHKSIHRLVAEAFIPNPDNKPQVNHIDGNKKNNAASNLEWSTISENQQHSYKVLDSTERRRKISESHKGKKLTEDNKQKLIEATSKKVVRIDDNRVFNSVSEAARLTKICQSSVSKACSGNLKRAGGYHWSYIN